MEQQIKPRFKKHGCKGYPQHKRIGHILIKWLSAKIPLATRNDHILHFP